MDEPPHPDDVDDSHEVSLLVRKRAVLAACKLLTSNGVTRPELVDQVLAKETEYFQYKIRRNIRRDKLQTVLKLFGFRSTDKHDPDEPPPPSLTEIPETEEQRFESQVTDFFKRWDTTFLLLITLVQTYYLLVIPFRCCYEIPRGLLSIVFEGIFCDCIMYAAIVQRVFEPCDQFGVLRWRGKNPHYWMTFWFFFDLVANFPFDYIGLGIGSACTLTFNRCALLAPYWQLNRLLATHGYLDNVSELVEMVLLKIKWHPYFTWVVLIFLFQTYMWHLFACFLFLDVLRLQWDFAIIEVGSTHMMEAATMLQYASALDWSSKVLAGWDRGSASPDDIGSFVFNFITVIYGCCIMTTYVAFVSGMVEMVTPYVQQTIDTDIIMDIVSYKRVPRELEIEMLGDSWYRFDSRTHMLRASEVCGELPNELHDRLLHYEGKRVLGRVSLFTPLLHNERFVIEIARLLAPVIMAPGEILCSKGDEGDAMYFVIDGELGVVDKDDHSIVLFRIKPGGFVGEIALLLGTSRTATVRVLEDFCRMLSLTKHDFDLLQRRFPNTFAKVHQMARDRWMESNKKTLEAARELGRQEIAEIARKRWEALSAPEEGLGSEGADDSGPGGDMARLVRALQHRRHSGQPPQPLHQQHQHQRAASATDHADMIHEQHPSSVAAIEADASPEHHQHGHRRNDSVATNRSDGGGISGRITPLDRRRKQSFLWGRRRDSMAYHPHREGDEEDAGGGGGGGGGAIAAAAAAAFAARSGAGGGGGDSTSPRARSGSLVGVGTSVMSPISEGGSPEDDQKQSSQPSPSAFSRHQRVTDPRLRSTSPTSLSMMTPQRSASAPRGWAAARGAMGSPSSASTTVSRTTMHVSDVVLNIWAPRRRGAGTPQRFSTPTVARRMSPTTTASASGGGGGRGGGFDDSRHVHAAQAPPPPLSPGPTAESAMFGSMGERQMSESTGAFVRGFLHDAMRAAAASEQHAAERGGAAGAGGAASADRGGGGGVSGRFQRAPMAPIVEFSSTAERGGEGAQWVSLYSQSSVPSSPTDGGPPGGDDGAFVAFASPALPPPPPPPPPVDADEAAHGDGSPILPKPAQNED